MQGGLRGAEGERRSLGPACGLLERDRVHPVGRDHAVGESDRERLLRADVAAGEDHLPGTCEPDQPGQPLGPTRAGDDPEPDLGQAELRVLGHDAEVARERELAPAAERVAVDGRQHRFRDLLQVAARLLERRDVRIDLGRAPLGHRLDVRAGGEDPLAPHSTTARTDGSSATAWAASWSSSETARPSAFAGGRSSRIVATAPCTSLRTYSPRTAPIFPDGRTPRRARPVSCATVEPTPQEAATCRARTEARPTTLVASALQVHITATIPIVSDRMVDNVVELLRRRGLRMTPQRRAIVAEIMKTQGHISPTASRARSRRTCRA